MKVKIKVMSMTRKDTIIVENNNMFVNGIEKEADIEKFLRRLFCIVASWESELINLAVLDGESYEINIDDGINVAKYIGKNKYPKNYGEFINLINEVI